MRRKERREGDAAFGEEVMDSPTNLGKSGAGSSMRARFARWVGDPGFWSMGDQGVVSAGNFVTAILLARVLAPREYGIFALLYALMLFMVSLHSALIAYGLSLQGASGTDAGLRPLAGGALVLTAGLGTALGMALGLVALLFHRASLLPWILLSLLFWQLQETTRRALMSRLRHRDAVWGDAISYAGQAAAVGYLFAAQRLTLASAFGVMAATSAAALLLQMAQLKLTLAHFRGALRLVGGFWTAGRWALFANVAQAFVSQALLWFLALGGMVGTASFQSLLNLLRVTNPVMLAASSVLLPTVAAHQGQPWLGLRAARRYGLLGGAALLPYLVLILLAPGVMLRSLYGASSPYAGLGVELRVLVLGSVLVYLAHILGAYYYGLSRGDVVLRSQLVAAAFMVVGGLALVAWAGVMGASVAYDIAFAAEVIAFAWPLRRKAIVASDRGSPRQPQPERAASRDSAEVQKP